MRNHVFITQGDLSQLGAHAVVFSTSVALDDEGQMYSAFRERVPGFEDGYAALRAELHDVEVGDTFWLDVKDRVMPLGVVVTAATAPGVPLLEASRRAVTASITRAVDEVRARVGDEGRVLVALPTFLVGKGGGRRERMELARAQVAAAYEALEQRPNVDVAFVAYTEANRHVYLSARRELLEQQPGDDGIPPVDDHLVDALRAGECVVFVGSGLSTAAGLPGWKPLIDALAKELDVRTQANDLDYYLDLAEWHRARFKDDPQRSLLSTIQGLFGDTAKTPPTLAHYLLGSLPVRHMVTTNWDDLVERALHALRRPTNKVVAEDEIPLTGNTGGVSVVKMHGDACDARDIVMSRDDYDTFFDRRPAMSLLLQGLLLNHTFLFVGYSLRDPNFRQIYSRISVMLQGARRPAFATTFDLASDYPRTQWASKKLHLIPFEEPDSNARFLRWLDALQDRAAGNAQVFLASSSSENEQWGQLQELRATLLRAADQVKRLPFAELTEPEALQVARALCFLVAEGWRPDTQTPLGLLWLKLARAIHDDVREKRRLLTLALAQSESLDEAELLRRELDALLAKA